MLVENFDKIYGQNLYTSNTMYEFQKDLMTIASLAHTMRLVPTIGTNKKPFTIIITKIKNSMQCGIYTDNHWDALEIFDVSRMDLKTMETFKKLLSCKISNHE